MYESLLKHTAEYQKISASLATPGPAALFGLPPAGRALLYAALQKDLGRVLCIVTPGEAEATHFADDLKALGLTAAVFPPRDFMLRPVACFPVLLIGTQSGAKPRRFISRSFTRYFTFPS